ncbi:MAG: hypothetical protein ABI564_06170 [Ideonella sp.]
MRRLVPVTLVGSLLLVAGHCAMALGMGQVRTTSQLGDPLRFSVALSSQPGEAIAEDCISAEVFSGAARIPDEMVRLSLERSANGLPTSLRVTTGTRIDEPLARVELAFNCGSSLKRSYVVFIDPPVLQLAEAGREPAAASTVSPRPPPRARSTATRSRSSRTASSRAAREAREARRAAVSGAAGASGAAPRQQRAAVAKSARQARSVAAATPSDRSSLKLESAPPALAGAPVSARQAPAGAAGSSAKSSSANASLGAASAAIGGAVGGAVAAAPTASAAVSGLLGELAAKAEADSQSANLEKVRLLEENLNKVRTDNQSMQRSMADLQTRLAHAEDNSVSMSLVYGLLALLLLLLLVIGGLLWRQASLRRESDWLKTAAAEEPPVVDAESVGAPRSIVHPVLPSAKASAEATAAAARLAEAATKPGPRSSLAAAAALKATALATDPVDAATPARLAAAVPHEITAIHDPRREVSVDELIDLEQQADFFGVLGQDDAAIDLLMGHLQGTGGVSPLPYLKLLEIHRRRNERAAYDRVRERFNRRFAAFAPEWEAHSGHDRSLQDYPAVIEQLQKQWPTPGRAMDTLSELLFQHDVSGQTFDLPAYGELLFLYSLARDLAEHEPPADGVDLLLPLGGDGEAEAKSSAGLVPLAAGGAAAFTAPATLPGELPAIRPHDDLDDLPDLEWHADSRLSPDTMPIDPTDRTPPRSGNDLSGLLDLDLHEPEEPKGPLSKY